MNDRPVRKNQQGEAHGPNQSRDELTALYDAYADRVYRYALMILADPPAAEDAVQQAFAKLAQTSQRILEIGSRERYLRVAVRNECYRLLKRRRRRRQVDLDSVPMLQAVEEGTGDENQRVAVEAALRSIPPDQREVVHMKVYEQMTFKQIGQLLGISINTAASRYRYAIEKLRELLALRCGKKGRSDG